MAWLTANDEVRVSGADDEALTRAAIEEVRDQAQLIFNTPNEKSRPGYLKMGWKEVGRISPWVRPMRLRRLVLGASAADPSWNAADPEPQA
jgi:hypothetical protein